MYSPQGAESDNTQGRIQRLLFFFIWRSLQFSTPYFGRCQQRLESGDAFWVHEEYAAEKNSLCEMGVKLHFCALTRLFAFAGVAGLLAQLNHPVHSKHHGAQHVLRKKSGASPYIHDIKKREPKATNESAALLLFNDLHDAFANLFSPLCHVRLQQQYISWNEKSVCSVVRELLWSRLLGCETFLPFFCAKGWSYCPLSACRRGILCFFHANSEKQKS